jgi:hypothetical protein
MEGAMKELDQIALDGIQGGGWLGDFGGGMACGLSIGLAAAIPFGVPIAVATCLWALG